MSERLDLIKSLIVKADTIADVGCDHGRVAEYLADSGICKHVIASDISENCLNKAKKRLAGKPDVSFVCCDGLGYECDEAVIAGMGGLLICSILKNAVKLPETLIVSPHRDCRAVRETLLSLGYGIDRDIDITDRNKYYSVIRAVMGSGRTELNEIELIFGADCDKPSLALREKLKRLYNTYMRAQKANAERIEQLKVVMQLQGMIIDG